MSSRQDIEREVRQKIEQENSNSAMKAAWTSEYYDAHRKVEKAVTNLVWLGVLLYVSIYFGLYGRGPGAPMFTTIFWIIMPIIPLCIYLLVRRLKALKKVPFKNISDQEHHKWKLEQEEKEQNRINPEASRLVSARKQNLTPFDRAELFYVNVVKGNPDHKNEESINADLDWLLKVLEYPEPQKEFLEELITLIDSGRAKTATIAAYKKNVLERYSGLISDRPIV